MARAVLTLDDNGDHLTLAISGAGPQLGRSRAQQLAVTLFQLAELNQKIEELPAHRRQPASPTLH